MYRLQEIEEEVHGVEGSQSSCRELSGQHPVLGPLLALGDSVGIIYAAGTKFKLPVTKGDHNGTYITVV